MAGKKKKERKKTKIKWWEQRVINYEAIYEACADEEMAPNMEEADETEEGNVQPEAEAESQVPNKRWGEDFGNIYDYTDEVIEEEGKKEGEEEEDAKNGKDMDETPEIANS